MDNQLEHAEKAMHYCAMIKKAVNGLCQILDLGDDPFDEMSRLETYKSIFRNAENGKSNTQTMFRSRARVL